MRLIYEYELIILDCDGVILDSNGVKISSMRDALNSTSEVLSGVDDAIEYFCANFGRSRFHHVKVFLESILTLTINSNVTEIEKLILEKYETYLDENYVKSDLTSGFIGFIERISVPKYVASGSEQNQLRRVLEEKGLSDYFSGIFGSPTPKSKNVANILNDAGKKNALLIGDSPADYEAASENGIDFLGFTPYSSSGEALLALAEEAGFDITDNWKKVL